MAPKSLLRHERTRSPVADFLPGTRFERVLLDEPARCAPTEVRRLLLCSGRLYVDLFAARQACAEAAQRTAILRLEQLSPFPYDRVAEAMERYPNAELVWCQEEPMNQGAWTYVRPRIETACRRNGADQGRALRYVGRQPGAAPATGLLQLHTAELEAVVLEAFA